jgi:hypothetical protein
LPIFISNDDGPAAPTPPLQTIFGQHLTRAPCRFSLCFGGIGEFDAFLIQYRDLATFDVKEVVRHLQKTPPQVSPSKLARRTIEVNATPSD